MNRFVILLRGVNVGGKNRLPMTALKQSLEEEGFTNVMTYIQSGNVMLETDLEREKLESKIEAHVSNSFTLDSSIVKVRALTKRDLQSVVTNKPAGFGEEPEKYHSDVIFLMGITVDGAMAVFSPRKGVDRIWGGDGVIYSQRLSARRTESRLHKIIGTPVYQSMTIRNWNTTTKLLSLLEAPEKTV